MHKILFAERMKIEMNWGGGLMGLESWTISKGGELDWQLSLLHWRLQWNIVALAKAASQAGRHAGRGVAEPTAPLFTQALITNNETKKIYI